MRLMIVLLAAFLGNAVLAVDAEPDIDDPVLQQRYEAIIREVRCLVCQNQTIADSTAPLAADLRREIRERIVAGASDQEIIDFLVARYGDFVLYRPPLKPTTWALWGAPFLLLAIGAVVFIRVLRARAAEQLEEEEEAA